MIKTAARHPRHVLYDSSWHTPHDFKISEEIYWGYFVETLEIHAAYVPVPVTFQNSSPKTHSLSRFHRWWLIPTGGLFNGHEPSLGLDRNDRAGASA
jgi:hypothetical protein